MNSIEALIAIMMILAIVGIVMQVHIESSAVLGDRKLLDQIEGKKQGDMRSGKIALGKGRTGGDREYLRWYFA